MVMLALSGQGILIVGVDRRPNGAVRVYVGSRGDGRYFLAWGEDAEKFARAWGGGGGSSHLLIDRQELEGVPIMFDDDGWQRHLERSKVCTPSEQ